MQKSIALCLAFLLAQASFGSSQASGAKGRSGSAKPKESVPAVPLTDLPNEPGLYAVFYTSLGKIVCRLFPEDAPKTVANFVALATGSKSWTDPATGRQRHTPLYTGTNFHRVIPDFMIQGGDPLGDGTGSPGYEFDDEISSSHHFEHTGVLAMANHGENTNGSQFFITVAPASHLDGHYSIFGEVVSGQDVADAISKVPRDSDDKPVTPVKLVRVGIRRLATRGEVLSGNKLFRGISFGPMRFWINNTSLCGAGCLPAADFQIGLLRSSPEVWTEEE